MMLDLVIVLEEGYWYPTLDMGRRLSADWRTCLSASEHI